MEEKYSQFLDAVRRFIPKGRILTGELDRLAWGTDAGFYRLVPQIVLRSDNERELSYIMRVASWFKVPVTFRAAGTSLSGQSVSDSVLVVAGKHWERFSVSGDGSQVTLEPGIIGARVNAILKPYGRKFGPDPASVGHCMVGGIVMNNASGMSCGTHANSDKLLQSARIVFADGTVLDTGDEASRKAFAESKPDFIREIEAIRDEVNADRELTDRIRYKYSIKNVTGLNIFPFVRFEDPFDIIAHLMVGSEGTLAFLSRVTMATLPIPAEQASGMIYFGTLSEGASAVVKIKKAMAPEALDAVELLDRRTLAAVNDPKIGLWPDKEVSALLIRVNGESKEAVKAEEARILGALEGFEVLNLGNGGADIFSDDPAVTGKYWKMRSGILPSTGGMRREGTTCLIEDVAFHIENFPQAIEDLSELLYRYGYDDCCIHGHALEGNTHFVLNQSFSTEEDVRRYRNLITDVVKMVIGKYDGSLKAEHGTGRNMAPFVEYEWGAKAFGIMKRVKALFDPDGVLNPGVIFNDDPECFIRNIKALPVLKPWDGEGRTAEPELAEMFRKLNKCIECGFCEVNCLSCGFTLSSRTRIVARREITRLRELPNPSGEEMKRLESLVNEYSYAGEQTCAADGLCSTSCPMGINVAELTHQLRRINAPEGSSGYRLWNFAADNFANFKGTLRGALRLASLGDGILGDLAMSGLCRWLHAKTDLPLWTPATPKAYYTPLRMLIGRNMPAGQTGAGQTPPKVVYFPSCINQMMGLPKHTHVVDKPLVEEMVSLLEKAGYEVIFPDGMASLCCGTIWESKGMPEIADRKTKELEDALWKASGEGRYPVLCDQSPCLQRMKKKIGRMKLYEPAEFILTFLKDRLEFHRTDTPVAVHLTCSMRLMGKTDAMLELARLCSSEVVVPEEVGCCGFAGDKGMTHPELNKYALRKLKSSVKGIPVGYSNSRTCEIGLTTNSGIPYVSIAYLVNSCTTAKPAEGKSCL